MLFLQILLIPIKIVLKIVGYSLAAAIKLVSFIIMAFSHVCGLLTNILGGIIILATIVYTVCGILNFGGIQDVDLWWLSSVTTGILGVVVSTLSLWVEILGDQIHYWGECLSDNVSSMGVLPC